VSGALGDVQHFIPPASTSMIITALLLPDLLLEVEAMAWTGHA
jgi:hypothetical protein